MDEQSSTTKMPAGVRIRNGKHGNSVEINLYIDGKRQYVETIYPATKAGIATASNIRQQFKQKEKLGILTHADIDSIRKNPQHIPAYDDNLPLFQDYAQAYLNSFVGKAQTKKKYLGILTNRWMPTLALMPIAHITAKHLRETIATLEFNSDRTFNDALIPLRAVFDLAFDDGVIEELPTKRLKNRKVQTNEPDPFTRIEMENILAHMDKTFDHGDMLFRWWYELIFWSGMRPGELLALRWSDIDWQRGKMSITKNIADGVEQFDTKTYKWRLIDLNERSHFALIKLKEITGKHGDFVICWETGERLASERSPRERFQKVLAELRIRERPAYNARHTYATMLLMDGCALSWVANQMGHSVLMLEQKYARWINGEANKKEVAKLNTGRPLDGNIKNGGEKVVSQLY